jgi:hypothetical protein
MANTKISELPTFTGNTGGTFIVMNDSGNTESFKVAKENLFSGYTKNGLTSTTGSWTVTPGTNNYSFTVDINNTYNLWVIGNIPNGIITYNATVTVSNNNVPVLGYQYGWNYTGAGNPILLTALPTQIIGTEGTISTASPSVGTTTNTFVFGIQNNNAENVTVNYGYLKISQ